MLLNKAEKILAGHFFSFSHKKPYLNYLLSKHGYIFLGHFYALTLENTRSDRGRFHTHKFTQIRSHSQDRHIHNQANSQHMYTHTHYIHLGLPSTVYMLSYIVLVHKRISKPLKV